MSNRDQQPKVVSRNPEHHQGFQSADALAKAQAASVMSSEDDGTEVVDGEVSDEAAPKVTAPTLDVTRMVQVRSRENIPSFTFGKKRYQINANKPTMIPLAVKMHLEEKGKL